MQPVVSYPNNVDSCTQQCRPARQVLRRGRAVPVRHGRAVQAGRAACPTTGRPRRAGCGPPSWHPVPAVSFSHGQKLTASPRNPTASARVAAPMSGRSRPLSVAARVRSGSWRGASGDIPAVSGEGGERRWTEERLTLQQRDGHAPDLERLVERRRRGTAFQPPLDRVQLLLRAVVFKVLALGSA